jgi:hypothetical protein
LVTKLADAKKKGPDEAVTELTAQVKEAREQHSREVDRVASALRASEEPELLAAFSDPVRMHEFVHMLTKKHKQAVTHDVLGPCLTAFPHCACSP